MSIFNKNIGWREMVVLEVEIGGFGRGKLLVWYFCGSKDLILSRGSESGWEIGRNFVNWWILVVE